MLYKQLSLRKLTTKHQQYQNKYGSKDNSAYTTHELLVSGQTTSVGNTIQMTNKQLGICVELKGEERKGVALLLVFQRSQLPPSAGI